MRIVYRFLFLSVLLIFVTNCARTGRPEGGPKDEDAPLFITAKPPYESVNFNKKEIKKIREKKKKYEIPSIFSKEELQVLLKLFP